MTAQEQGMLRVGEACRIIVPPQLDFVVVVYPREAPIDARNIAYITSTTASDMEAKAITAAQVFAVVAKGNLAKGND